MEFATMETYIFSRDICGSYDWIVEPDILYPYLDSRLTRISDPSCSSCLVIGCGTSTMSSLILNKIGYGNILSIDILPECIEKMAEVYKNESRLQWDVYDINMIHDNSNGYEGSTYDIIIDKGTFDAILVEGSVVYMLGEIKRLLKTRGVYFLCSFHSLKLLEPLLTARSLGFEVQFYFPNGRMNENTENRNCTVAICFNANPDTSYDCNALFAIESVVLNNYYIERCPYLTPSKVTEIQMFYNNECNNNYKDYITIYNFIFQNDTSLGYTFEMFMEDVDEFIVSNEGYMNYNEIIQFLSEKQ